MNWSEKIAAFLRPNPLAAFGATDDALRRLQAALPGTSELPEMARWGYEQSQGLELLVNNLAIDHERSRRELVVRHPLSGASTVFPLPRPLTDEDLRLLHDRFCQAVSTLRDATVGTQGPQTEDQARRLFFALWRLLPQTMRDVEATSPAAEARLGQLWDILPADPRMPSTTIWQQASLASAIAGTGGRPALAVVDVAGIQAFLGTARRTQDLWAGSYLASYLIWRSIAQTIQHFGPDCFLFPSLQDSAIVDHWMVHEAKLIGQSLLSVPQGKANPRLAIGSFPERLTVILPSDCAEDACQAIEATICSTWQAIADQVQLGVEAATQSILPNWSSVCDSTWRNRWRDDIASVWRDSVTWLVVPWPSEGDLVKLQAECQQLDPAYQSHLDDEIRQAIIVAGGRPTVATNYSIVSRYAGRSLQARKMHRSFAQVTAPAGFHCSLSGTQMALYPSSENVKLDLKLPSDANVGAVVSRFWERLADVDRAMSHGQQIPKLRGRIRPNEQLSCTSLVKRLALQEYFEAHSNVIDRHIFPSTAGIATAWFKASVLRAYAVGKLRKELEEYVTTVRAMLTDDDAFFPANPLPRLTSIVEQLELTQDTVIGQFLKIDGDWLYPESFDLRRLTKEHQTQFDPKGVERARNALQTFLLQVKRVLGIEPGRKMAIVSMDGDKLGEWIAGARAPVLRDAFHADLLPTLTELWLCCADTTKQPLTLSRHLAISESLRVFSQVLVPLIVEERYFGKIVYCGGDDVLAVVAVEDLLELSEELRRAFVGLDLSLSDEGLRLTQGYLMDDKSLRIFPLGGVMSTDGVQAAAITTFLADEPANESMTCSIGAVVVHERSPLSHAVATCFNEALKHGAKDARGRNAFEFHLQQRSGSVLVCGGQWSRPSRHEVDGVSGATHLSTVRLLHRLRESFRASVTSPRLIYEMANYADGFSGSPTDESWLVAGKAALRMMVKSHTSAAQRTEVYADLCGLLDLQHELRLDRARDIEARGCPDKIPVDDSWRQVCDLLKAVQSI